MILIFGIGNILMGDEGFGSLFAQEYKNEIQNKFSGKVRVVDVGTHTIPVLDLLKDCQYLIFIDNIQIDTKELHGNSGNGSGINASEFDPSKEIRIIDKDRLIDYEKNKLILSSHSGGIQEIIQAAELIDYLPEKIMLLGVKAQDISTRVGLSDKLQKLMPHVKEFLFKELEKELSQ